MHIQSKNHLANTKPKEEWNIKQRKGDSYVQPLTVTRSSDSTAERQNSILRNGGKKSMKQQ